jgi:hypothetical protein
VSTSRWRWGTPGGALPRRQRKNAVCFSYPLRRDWELAYAEDRINVLTPQRAYDAVHAITLPADSTNWRRHNLRSYPALEV